MKIIEIISDYILEFPIMEMAVERKFAIHQIHGLSMTLSDHLIKLYAFDDNARDHWIKEINSFLNKIDNYKLKPNSKKLSGDTYYRLLFSEPLDSGADEIGRRIEKMQSDEYSECKRSSLSNAMILEKLEKLLRTISFDMANNKYKSFRNYI